MEVSLTQKELFRIFDSINIDRNTDCWVWLGAKNRGYGAINYRGKSQKVHRVMYAAIRGPLPKYTGTEVLDHLCDNKACCNPSHLELIRQKYNLLRANSVSGRNARKTHCPRGHTLPKPNERTPHGMTRRCIPCRQLNKRNRYHRQKTSRIPTKEFANS